MQTESINFPGLAHASDRGIPAGQAEHDEANRGAAPDGTVERLDKVPVTVSGVVLSEIYTVKYCSVLLYHQSGTVPNMKTSLHAVDSTRSYVIFDLYQSFTVPVLRHGRTLRAIDRGHKGSEDARNVSGKVGHLGVVAIPFRWPISIH